MPPVVLLASGSAYRSLEGQTGVYRLEQLDGEPANAILDRVSRGVAVVAAYEGAAGEAPSIWGRIAEGGVNPFYYMPVDPVEEGFSGGIELGVLARARASLLAAAPSPGRGSVASNPFGRVVLPSLTSEASCLMLRGCTACIEYCPRDALQGKPPKVNTGSCSGCGVCTAACPVSVLEMPGFSFRPLEYFLDQLPAGGVLVPVCHPSYPGLVERLGREPPGRRVVLLPLPCSSWLTPLHALQALYRGHSVVSVCDASNEACSPGYDGALRGLPAVLEPVSVEEAPRIIGGLPDAVPLGDSTLTVRRPELVHRVAEAYGVDDLLVGSPAIGDVEVDTGKCMVCDACSATCPYGALRLVVEGDRIKLVFDHARCTACHMCEYACPYNAIRVSYRYRADRYGRRVPLAEDEVARCRMCGAPLGSMKMMRHVEEQMRRMGASELALRQLWLCPRCKLRGLSESSGGD